MTSGRTKLPELLAPAGSRKAFLGALKAGADAVYLAERNSAPERMRRTLQKKIS